MMSQKDAQKSNNLIDLENAVISVKGISKKYFINSNNHHKKKLGFIYMLLNPNRIPENFSFASQNGNTNDNQFWALKDINFDVYPGERLGIIGKNGAGKTTLLRILSRLTYPTEGEAIIRGTVTPLFAVGTGFKADLTGKENIFMNASLHGLTKSEIQDKYDEIVKFSEIEKFINMPIKYYSRGMKSRLAFSVAAHLDPDILILDEVLSVGDVSFQEKCLKRVEGITGGGRTLMFVSHSMSAVRRFCTRTIWLDRGRIVMDGTAEKVSDAYLSQVSKVTSTKVWSTSPPPEVIGSTGDNKDASDDTNDNNTIKQDVIPESNASETDSEEKHARLVSARVINSDHESIISISADQRVGLEVVYDVLIQKKLLLPAFTLDKSDTGDRIFTVVYTEPEYMRCIKPVGRYRSTVWIPGNLLNLGQISVTVSITTPAAKLERHVVEEKVISFYVVEVPHDVVGAGGLYRKVPGAVRPKLEWETQEERRDEIG